MENDIKLITSEFFDKLWVTLDELNILNVDNSNNIFNIKIKTKESSLLIWYHWKTIDSIQNILKSIYSKKFEQNIIIHLEINDYMKSKDDRLFDFINSKIILLKNLKKDIKLPFYSAYNRKKIHSFISELNDNNICTNSIWEWKDRRLYISIKSKKLSIDIDSNEI